MTIRSTCFSANSITIHYPYLPAAFADAGYAFGLFALLISLFMYIYSSSCLLECWKVETIKKQISNNKKKQEENLFHYDDNVDNHHNQHDGIEMTSLVKKRTNSPPTASDTTNNNDKTLSDNNTDSDNATVVTTSSNSTVDSGTIINNNKSTTSTTIATTKTIVTKMKDEKKDLESQQHQQQKQNQSSSGGNANSSDHNHNNSISYAYLAKKSYGNVGEIIVRTGIMLMQLGVCLTYCIFVPNNISRAIEEFYVDVNIPMWFTLLLLVVIEIPLCCIRNVRRLVHTNIIANCLILFGLLSCIWLALHNNNVNSNSNLVSHTTEGDNNSNSKDGASDDYSHEESMLSKLYYLSPLNDKWYLFIGTSVLLFEGSITLCIPLQEALQSREDVANFPAVYKMTLIGIIIFYTFFAIICWVAFGDDVKTPVTISLPDGILTTLVQLAYSIAVVFTFPLQMYPSLENMFHYVSTHMSSSSSSSSSTKEELSNTQRLAVVTVAITLLAIIAVVEMDNLGRVVSLMGALLGVPLAFVFPPLIHTRIADSSKRIQNYAVAGFGLMCMVLATFCTLATWNNSGERRRLLFS